MLTSGTSIIWFTDARYFVSTSSLLEWKREMEQVRIPGTLLGPEGSSYSNLLDHHPLVLPALEPASEGPWWYRPLLENYTVDASIFVARQATKCTWWMPWHQEPMKDVGACDKPREVGNRAVIRGFPNGETQLESCPVTSA